MRIMFVAYPPVRVMRAKCDVRNDEHMANATSLTTLSHQIGDLVEAAAMRRALFRLVSPSWRRALRAAVVRRGPATRDTRPVRERTRMALSYATLRISFSSVAANLLPPQPLPLRSTALCQAARMERFSTERRSGSGLQTPSTSVSTPRAISTREQRCG